MTSKKHSANETRKTSQRFVIFGNSGSGKSTYAKRLTKHLQCAHMDLDTIAWSPEHATPTRRPVAQSAALIEQFMSNNVDWVIEGCYADLLSVAMAQAPQVVFLNPGVETCVANAKRRPWEPHKYETPEAQDANLNMLIKWIEAYYEKSDEFSFASHRRLFDEAALPKQELHSNDWPAI